LLPAQRPEFSLLMRRRTWLIIALIAIPLWLIGAGGEIADSFLIRKEGRVTTGQAKR
jgi:hypothetical protein